MSAVNPTIEISDSQALCDLVERSGAQRVPLVDYGVAHRGLGHAPPSSHTQLVQRARGTGVIEHYLRDLTVRTAAGATFAQLANVLKESNQFLPIDADDDMTVGEIIAHDVYGPLRAGFGSVRDLLLGLRYIDADARDIHVGGRTVKNVAGYDVTRLLVGALGELGIIHEATLRTYAIPPEVRAVEIAMEDPAVLCAAITHWLLSDASPTAISLHAPASTGAGGPEDKGWIARVSYFNSDLGCDAQVAALRKLLPALAGSGAKITGVEERDFAQDHARRAAERAWRRSAPVLVKLVVPPASTGSACRILREARISGDLRIDALPVHGCIFAGGELNADQAGLLDRAIAQVIAQGPAFRAWYNRPDAAMDIEPFAPRQSDYAMQCRLKSTMDPCGLFNPGRYLK
jgi:FAD/FMN-containing dehydrogenase